MRRLRRESHSGAAALALALLLAASMVAARSVAGGTEVSETQQPANQSAIANATRGRRRYAHPPRTHTCRVRLAPEGQPASQSALEAYNIAAAALASSRAKKQKTSKRRPRPPPPLARRDSGGGLPSPPPPDPALPPPPAESPPPADALPSRLEPAPPPMDVPAGSPSPPPPLPGPPPPPSPRPPPSPGPPSPRPPSPRPPTRRPPPPPKPSPPPPPKPSPPLPLSPPPPSPDNSALPTPNPGPPPPAPNPPPLPPPKKRRPPPRPPPPPQPPSPPPPPPSPPSSFAGPCSHSPPPDKYMPNTNDGLLPNCSEPTVLQALGPAISTYHYYSSEYLVSTLYCADAFADKPQDWLMAYPWVAYCAPYLGGMTQDKCGKCLRITNANGSGVRQIVRMVDMCGHSAIDSDWWSAFIPLDNDGMGYFNGHLNVTLELVAC